MDAFAHSSFGPLRCADIDRGVDVMNAISRFALRWLVAVPPAVCIFLSWSFFLSPSEAFKSWSEFRSYAYFNFYLFPVNRETLFADDVEFEFDLIDVEEFPSSQTGVGYRGRFENPFGEEACDLLRLDRFQSNNANQTTGQPFCVRQDLVEANSPMRVEVFKHSIQVVLGGE